MKRKATDDISTSPRKVAKAKAGGAQDSEQGNKRGEPATAGPSEAQQPALPEESATPSEGENPDKTEHAAVQGTNDDQATKALRDQADGTPASTRQTGDAHGAQPQDDTTEEADPVRNQQREEWLAAMSFLMQLQLVLERYRTFRTIRTTAQRRTQLTSLVGICERAANKELQENPRLMFLPLALLKEFDPEVGNISCMIDEAQRAGQALEGCDAEMTRCLAAHDEALGKRGDALLKLSDSSEKALAAHERAVDGTWRALQKAHEARNQTEATFNALADTVDRTGLPHLQVAEELLVQKGYLRPVPGTQGSESTTERERLVNEGVAARTFLAQLQLVLQRARAMKSSDARKPARNFESRRKQSKSLVKLCDMANSEQIRQHQHVEFLESYWFRDLERAEAAIRVAGDAEGRLQHSENERRRCQEAHDTSLKERGKALLGMTDSSDEAMGEHDRACTQALMASEESQREYERAFEAYIQAADELDRQGLFVVPMLHAEDALLREGYLRPKPEAPAGQAQDIAEDEEARGQRSRYYSHYSQYSGSGSLRGFTRQSGFPPFHQPPGTRNNIIKDVHDSAIANLQKASDRWNKAVDEFERVRNDYYADLHYFLKDRKRGKEKGTKVDFDGSYFIERNKATHNLARAKEEYERALEEADAIDALTPEQRCKLFGDEKEIRVSGKEIDLEHDLIWQDQKGEVEAWLDDTTLKEAGGAVATEPSCVSLTGLSEFCARPDLAKGKERRWIDSWQMEQAKVRKRGGSDS